MDNFIIYLKFVLISQSVLKNASFHVKIDAKHQSEQRRSMIEVFSGTGFDKLIFFFYQHIFLQFWNIIMKSELHKYTISVRIIVFLLKPWFGEEIDNFSFRISFYVPEL